VVVVVVCGHVS
jgi:hypothetical protein